MRPAQAVGSGRSSRSGALRAEVLLVGGRGEVDGQGVLDVAVRPLARLGGQPGPADGLVEGDRRRQGAARRRDVQRPRAHDGTSGEVGAPDRAAGRRGRRR